MSPFVLMVLMVVAIVLLLAAAFGVPKQTRVLLGWAGLALWAIVYTVQAFSG